VDVVQLVDRRVDLARRKVWHGGSATPLTDQEAALLSYLVARPGRVVSRDELLERVWGYADSVVTRAVDAAVRRLRNKIEADAADPVHLVTVHGVGYRYDPVVASAEEEVVAVADWGDGLRDVEGTLHEEVVAIARDVVEQTARRHGGTVQISTPEAVVTTFALPLSAVRFALGVQRELVAAAWPEPFERRLRVRLPRPGPPEVWRGLLARIGVGPDRAVALRQCAAAFVGQIRVAGPLASTIGSAADLGALPGPSESDDALELVPVELAGRRFPSRGGSRLPPIADAFVGRRQRLAALGEAVAADRLVTLTGPPGVGKTRLATELAHRWADGGRVWFCDLAPAGSLGEVVHIAAEALGVPVRGAHEDSAVHAIGMALAGRGTGLLILDDFERFVEHAESTVGAWRALAPDIHVVVTSRQRLALPGEHVIEVPPLAPDDAVALFEARAEPGLHERDRATIEQIVRRVDGLPLAIELSAARTPVLAPVEILEQLSATPRARFAVLRDPRDAGDTLWNALESSWGQLAEPEREALTACAGFRGPFDLSAAAAILDSDDATLTADRLTALRDRSLLQAHRDPTGRLRFTMLGSVRDHAWSKLDEAGRSQVRGRHRRHFASLGADGARARLSGPDGPAWLVARGQELPDLVAALESACEAGDGPCAAGLAGVLAAVAVRRGALFTVARALAPAEAVATDDVDRSRVGVATSEVLDAMGDARAVFVAGEAVEAAQRSGRDALLARAHLQLGRALAHRADEAAAEGHFGAALSHAERAGDARVRAQATGALANVHSKRGEPELAELLYARADAWFAELGDARGRALVAANLAAAMADAGQLAGARQGYSQAIAQLRDSGEIALVAHVLCNLGNVLTALDELSRAESVLREAHAIHAEIGNLRGQGRARLLQAEARLVADPEDPDIATLLDEAIDALERAGDRRNLGLAQVTRGKWWIGVDPGAARVALRAGLANLRRTEDFRSIAFALLGRSWLERREGRFDAARDAIVEAEELARQADDTLTAALVDCERGLLALARGEREEATRRRARAEATREALALPSGSVLGRAISSLDLQIAGVGG